MRSGSKPPLPTLKTQENTENHNLLEQKLWAESLGGPAPAQKPWATADELLEAQCGWAWGKKPLGGPSRQGPPRSGAFSCRSSTRFSHKYWRNSLHASDGRRGQGAILKHARTFCTSQQGSPSGEGYLTISPECNLVGNYQNITDLVGGKHPAVAHSGHTVPRGAACGMKWQLRRTVQAGVQRRRLTARPAEVTGLGVPPLPLPHHHITRGLLTAVLLTQYTMSEKNYEAYWNQKNRFFKKTASIRTTSRYDRHGRIARPGI